MFKGKLISFIGMDGAGKSTLVDIVGKVLEQKGFKVTLVYAGRGRANLLPIQLFGKIYRKAGGIESNVSINGQKFEKTNIMHTLAAPIFAADLLLRYFFILLPKLMKNDFLLTDRYSTDILLMNKVSMNLKKFLYWFVPKPNKILYIYNTVSVLHKRKPEHPVRDLKRQEKLFAKIFKFIKVYKIKNNKINRSTSDVIRIIDK